MWTASTAEPLRQYMRGSRISVAWDACIATLRARLPKIDGPSASGVVLGGLGLGGVLTA